jgi:hypothetical protein
VLADVLGAGDARRYAAGRVCIDMRHVTYYI